MGFLAIFLTDCLWLQGAGRYTSVDSSDADEDGADSEPVGSFGCADASDIMYSLLGVMLMAVGMLVWGLVHYHRRQHMRDILIGIARKHKDYMQSHGIVLTAVRNPHLFLTYSSPNPHLILDRGMHGARFAWPRRSTTCG